MKKYKIRFRDSKRNEPALNNEEPFHAINKNCFILVIEDKTDEIHHMKIHQEIRYYSDPMGTQEIMDYIAGNPDSFPPEVACCKGLILEDDGHEKVYFKEKIEIKRSNKNNKTKGPPE